MAKKRFNFWLDDQYPGDVVLDQLITELKHPEKGMGLFTRAIREGLRLWNDSRKGSYKVWVELFPKVAAKYLADSQKQIKVSQVPPPDTKALEDKIARLEELLLEVTKGTLMIQQYQSVIPTTTALPAAGQGKPAPAPVMKAAAVASADTIADNFLSMFQ